MTARSVATVTARLRSTKCKRSLNAPLGKRAVPRAGAVGFLFWRHRHAHPRGGADRHRRRETMRGISSALLTGAGGPAPHRLPALSFPPAGGYGVARLLLPCYCVFRPPALPLPYFRRHSRATPAPPRETHGRSVLHCFSLGVLP